MSQVCAEARNTLFNLVHFPTEIFAHILSFHELAKPILRLYMAGSRVLQHKVLLAASNMHLESRLELDFARLPSLIAQMTSLRALTIERGGHKLLDENHTLEVLKSVAPTLEKLVLRMSNCSKLFELRDLSVLSVSTDTFEDALLDPNEPSNYLASRFQRLQWLELDHLSAFACTTPYRLPPTLTHLEVRFLRTLCLKAKRISDDDINKLPPNLTHLNLYMGKIVGNEPIRLPPSLVELEIRIPRKEAMPPFAAMPHSLTSVLFPQGSIEISTLLALPPLLRTFEVGIISDLATFDPVDAENVERITYLRRMAQEAGFVFDETLPTLTPREYGVYDLLPRTLTKFVLVYMMGDQPPTGHWQSLPKRLSHLVLLGSTDDLDYLPFETVDKFLSVANVAWKDKHVKRLNPRLLELSARNSTWDVTSEFAPWMPREPTIGGDFVCEELEELQAQRREALENLDREAFHALNPRN